MNKKEKANSKDFQVDIPVHVITRIDEIEEWYQSNPLDRPGKKVAVFDMDNTLLTGDIGDALFVQLKREELDHPVTIDKKPIPWTWSQYRQFLEKKGKEEAYTRVITSMAGIPVDTVVNTARSVMNLPPHIKYLESEGEDIPVPRIYPAMHAVVSYLQSLDYDIYIISATIQCVVRDVVERYFNIPADHAFGMTPTTTKTDTGQEIIGDQVIGPVTVTGGKVKVYHKEIGMIPPLVSGGDSPTDIPMLNLTHPHGVIIWVERKSALPGSQEIFLKEPCGEAFPFLPVNE